MAFFKRDDSHQFKPLLVEIEEAPLNPLGRLIFWLVLAAFFLALAWAFFGRVDVVVSARGRFVPFGEVKVVQPLTTGVVRAIRVSAGDYVKKGDVLLEIDPSDTEPELDSRREELRRGILDVARLRALLGGEGFKPDPEIYPPRQLREAMALFRSARDRLDKQIRAKTAELQAIDEQLATAESALVRSTFQLEMSRERVDRLRKVRDIISYDEWQEAEQTLQKDLATRIADEHHIGEIKASRNRVSREREFVRDDQENRWLEDLNDLLGKQEQLAGTIKKAAFYNARQKLKSPVNGFISRLLVHTTGGVVTPAEKLVSIVPVDSPLMVKAMVLSRDIGFVAAGMKAGIKVDTFDFQKYGLIEGIIEKVGRDSIEDKQMGLVYEILARPEKTSLMVEGRPRQISVGMGATVEVKVGRRRIIELFIYPAIKYFKEGVGVR